jgi:hypothetical protein
MEIALKDLMKSVHLAYVIHSTDGVASAHPKWNNGRLKAVQIGRWWYPENWLLMKAGQLGEHALGTRAMTDAARFFWSKLNEETKGFTRGSLTPASFEESLNWYPRFVSLMESDNLRNDEKLLITGVM